MYILKLYHHMFKHKYKIRNPKSSGDLEISTTKSITLCIFKPLTQQAQKIFKFF